MKHTFFGHTFEKVTDEELNVLQVALVHLIEDLEDASDESLLPQYSGKKIIPRFRWEGVLEW